MVPAAGVVGEAMVLLTLADFVLQKTGGDSMAEVRASMDRWRETLAGAGKAAHVHAADEDEKAPVVGSGGDD